MIIFVTALVISCSVLQSPDREMCEFRERQARLQCANHPEDCFRPESELEREQREFKERQKRIKEEDDDR